MGGKSALLRFLKIKRESKSAGRTMASTGQNNLLSKAILCGAGHL